jgi:histidinol dehydrogenase
LVEAFVYKAAIAENTYHEERHHLDQQVALAELEHLEAHEDEIEVEGALNFL